MPNVEPRKDWPSPLLAPNLRGLPPSLMLVAGFDPLNAEGEAYAARLQKVGITIIVKHYSGQMQRFMSNATLLPEACDAIEDIAAVLKAANG